MQGILLDVSKARRAMDKKARRSASRKARQDGKGIEAVIRHSAGAGIDVPHVELDMNALYVKARKDLGLRIELGRLGRTDPAAAKRRRQLNDWELDTKPQGAGEAFNPDSETTRRARGRCDAQAIQQRNSLKRNGGH